ncbi:MAG TPA: hypothetical protein VFE33_01345 [Thermoanaerobaculia bacterium]|nr:hypothetical protein [Thermoanaerobaculia bacterium]
MFTKKTFVLFTLSVALAGAANAATTLTLPDSSQTTSLSATVSEQARVTVPATVSFTVSNVGSSTASASQSVTVDNIVLADGKKLKISLEADAADFTAPTGGTVTWAATDVSWNAATWGGTGTGNATSLSDSAFGEVARSAANDATLSSTDLVFTLAAKSTVDRAGSHTLGAHWKFESF